MNKAGEKCSYSTGEKLPESTGDKLPESTGEIFGLYWGSGSTGGSGIPPGNNLILRLPGMLVKECLYSAGKC